MIEDSYFCKDCSVIICPSFCEYFFRYHKRPIKSYNSELQKEFSKCNGVVATGDGGRSYIEDVPIC